MEMNVNSIGGNSNGKLSFEDVLYLNGGNNISVSVNSLEGTIENYGKMEISGGNVISIENYGECEINQINGEIDVLTMRIENHGK